MKNPTSKSYDIYSNSDFVKQYLESIKDNPWNTYYERPSTLSLLPDIHNRRILDAGCGPGIVSRELLNRGGIVTSVDFSPAMIETAKNIVGNKANVILLDLNSELHMFNDNCFDVIYCSLTIHYINDLDLLFSEFFRIMSPRGIFIFSTDHPESPALTSNPVLRKRTQTVFWSGFNISLEIIQRPWNDILGSLRRSGFTIDKIINAKPTDECQIRFPDVYQDLKLNRHFICVRVVSKKAT